MYEFLNGCNAYKHLACNMLDLQKISRVCPRKQDIETVKVLQKPEMLIRYYGFTQNLISQHSHR